MTTESFMDQIKAFGARLGLPKVDVDKLVDIQLKNIDALGRSAQTAGEGAKALADKQREIIEAAFKETSAMVRDFHPVGDPQGTLAKQKDYAKKAFELTMQNTRDVGDLAKKTTTEATTIIRDRLRESLTEENPNWSYNDLARWRYAELPRALGCADWFAARVTTLGELDAAMKAARESKFGAYIEVVGQRMDMPPILAFAHGRLGTMYGDAP
jgi:phasin family protein